VIFGQDWPSGACGLGKEELIMGKTVAVTDQDFEQEVVQAEMPVLVDFWADWCAPCRMIAPIIEELAVEYEGRVKFAKVDVDGNPSISMQYGVRSIPTLLVFKDGVPVEQVVGVVPKAQLVRRLDSALGQ